MHPMKQIEQILAPVAFEEFARIWWGRQFLHQRGAAGRFADLLTWEALDDALREQPWSHPELRVFQGEEPVPEGRFLRAEAGFLNDSRTYPDVGALNGLLLQGGLLAVSGAQSRFARVRRLAAAFEYVFREHVMVNAYAACARSRGFPVHWDDHEVFVLQVSGRKHWRVFGRSVEAPLFRDAHPDDAAPEDPLWTGELVAGDLLYLPRGFWHVAESAEEPTLHLTVGLDCATGLNLLGWLARELRSSALFRTDLPRLGTPEDRRRHAAGLREELLAHLDDAMVDRFLASDDAAAPALRLAGLRPSGATTLRWLPPRPVAVRVEVGLGRFLEFEALERLWHLPRWMEPVVRLLVEEGEIPRGQIRDQLRGALPVNDIDDAVLRLVTDGLAEEVAVP
jgi:hypothetical protein